VGADVIDPRPVPLGDLPPGDYAVEIGLYSPGTGARLTITDGAGRGSDRVRLPEPLRVTPAPVLRASAVPWGAAP
jgi:hypothetical protein